MAKQFDATLNTLIDAHLTDWASFLAGRVGVPVGPVTALDTDLSATLQADRLFRLDGPTPTVLHLELESTSRLGIPSELLRYNVAAWGVTGLPVTSVLVLLRPKANASDQSGHLVVSDAASRPYLEFRYTVIRVWDESIAGLLGAGLELAPLAMLTNEAAAAIFPEPSPGCESDCVLRLCPIMWKADCSARHSCYAACATHPPKSRSSTET